MAHRWQCIALIATDSDYIPRFPSVTGDLSSAVDKTYAAPTYPMCWILVDAKLCLFPFLSFVISDHDILSTLLRNRPQLAKAGPQLQPQSREGEGSQRRWWDQHSGRGSLELGGAAHHVILQVPGTCFPVNYFISFE